MLIFVLSACATAATDAGPELDDVSQNDRPTRPDGLPTAVVTRISDGDTIIVHGDEGEREIRLLGVNTPENGECFADEPRQYLTSSLEGETVGLEIAGDDQFGRTLASVWLDDDLINLDLVGTGMAIAVTPQEEDPYGSRLLAAEEEAYRRGAGLWSGEACGSDRPLPELSFDLAASQINPPGPDEQSIESEFIVIANNGDDIVDLGGWTLRDESSRNRLTFAGPIVLAGGATLSITSGCSTIPAWCSDTPVWNNRGDMALLLDASGSIVARARY